MIPYDSFRVVFLNMLGSFSLVAYHMQFFKNISKKHIAFGIEILDRTNQRSTFILRVFISLAFILSTND